MPREAEAIDDFLLCMVDGTSYQDFKDYKEEVLDWSWDNILNGE